VIGLVIIITGSISIANAELQSVIGGTGAPSSALGPYTMTPFEDDLRLCSLKYSYVKSPVSGSVYFDLPLEHQEVLKEWLTWSHNYTGDVYWTGNDEHLVSLILPAGTSAFYFYVQPNNIPVDTISAIAFDGFNCRTKLSQEVTSISGACYYGFYGTDGTCIESISIYSESAGFAIGEFGIAVIPSPCAFVLVNLGLCVVLELQRRKIFDKKIM